MSTFALKAARFLLPASVRHGGYLIVRDGLVDHHQPECPAVDVVDLGDAWVAPGFVDTHIHGLLGHDVMDCDPRGVHAMARGLLRHGVTSWLPTTLTAPVGELEEACACVARAALANDGARIQGLFLEGPCFTERHKGAQNPAYFLDPSIALLERWQEAADGLVMKVAVAAERPGAPAFCGRAADLGVTVALGHSDATFAEVEACLNAGATVFVHTYNGMSPLHHRDPGMVGAALVAHGAYAEAICDGHHLHPMAVRALVEARGWDHVVLVTDSMRAGGMPDGDYTLGEFPVRVEGGAARLTDGSGSLAGSVLTLDRAVRNVVEWDLVGPEQAIRMATEVAADSAGLGGVCGRLLPGRQADLCVLAPDLTVRRTYLGGVCVHEA